MTWILVLMWVKRKHPKQPVNLEASATDTTINLTWD